MAPFCLDDYDCIAFDMDHTLLRYNLPALSTMIYKSITEYLRQEKNYDPTVLSMDIFEKHQDLCMRGLIFDYRRGNFLKLGGNGSILSCIHGFEELSEEQISAEYGLERVWSSFDFLKKNLCAGPGFAVFESFYTTPIIPLICALVDHFNKKNGGRMADYEFLWKDICAAFEGNFHYSAFKAEKFTFMPSLKAEPWKYVYKLPETTIEWLKKLRKANKVVVLITYTFANLAEHLMSYAIDSDWKELFDFIIGYARKPGFFHEETSKDIPFYTMTKDEELSEEEVTALHPHKIYMRGSSCRFEREVMAHLGRVTVPRFVYFGDSIRGDVYGPAKHTENWDAVAIVEEMQWEEKVLPVVSRGEELGENCPLLLGEKLKSDELFTCSQRWGSFFFDDRDTSDGKRTFWTNVIRKYSKLAVPWLENIVQLPIDVPYLSP